MPEHRWAAEASQELHRLVEPPPSVGDEGPARAGVGLLVGGAGAHVELGGLRAQVREGLGVDAVGDYEDRLVSVVVVGLHQLSQVGVDCWLSLEADGGVDRVHGVAEHLLGDVGVAAESRHGLPVGLQAPLDYRVRVVCEVLRYSGLLPMDAEVLGCGPPAEYAALVAVA